MLHYMDHSISGLMPFVVDKWCRPSAALLELEENGSIRRDDYENEASYTPLYTHRASWKRHPHSLSEGGWFPYNHHKIHGSGEWRYIVMFKHDWETRCKELKEPLLENRITTPLVIFSKSGMIVVDITVSDRSPFDTLAADMDDKYCVRAGRRPWSTQGNELQLLKAAKYVPAGETKIATDHSDKVNKVILCCMLCEAPLLPSMEPGEVPTHICTWSKMTMVLPCPPTEEAAAVAKVAANTRWRLSEIYEDRGSYVNRFGEFV